MDAFDIPAGVSEHMSRVEVVPRADCALNVLAVNAFDIPGIPGIPALP
ncbi:hypothetical protein [Luteitalea pratensis]|nr:hypothetical protein [Luteitalea pratensis]